jgi:hypothetical protein
LRYSADGKNWQGGRLADSNEVISNPGYLDQPLYAAGRFATWYWDDEAGVSMVLTSTDGGQTWQANPVSAPDPWNRGSNDQEFIAVAYWWENEDPAEDYSMSRVSG